MLTHVRYWVVGWWLRKTLPKIMYFLNALHFAFGFALFPLYLKRESKRGHILYWGHLTPSMYKVTMTALHSWVQICGDRKFASEKGLGKLSLFDLNLSSCRKLLHGQSGVIVFDCSTKAAPPAHKHTFSTLTDKHTSKNVRHTPTDVHENAGGMGTCMK